MLWTPGKDRRLSKVRAIGAGLVPDSGHLALSELSKRGNRDSSTFSTEATKAPRARSQKSGEAIQDQGRDFFDGGEAFIIGQEEK